MGFGASSVEGDYEKMKERILDELKRTFRPEFLNRIDDLIVFHSLNEEHIRQIVDIMLDELNHRIEEFSLHMEVDEAVKGILLKEGFDPKFGARPLRRVIQRRLEDGISEELLQGKIAPGDTVAVSVGEKDSLLFTKKSS
jgi:ATP-dependent Clp protease ATP-binding subunit ClpC